jgi:hypothetical protein
MVYIHYMYIYSLRNNGIYNLYIPLPAIKSAHNALAVYMLLHILAVYTYSISLTHPWDASIMKTSSSVCLPDR